MAQHGICLSTASSACVFGALHIAVALTGLSPVHAAEPAIIADLHLPHVFAAFRVEP